MMPALLITLGLLLPPAVMSQAAAADSGPVPGSAVPAAGRATASPAGARNPKSKRGRKKGHSGPAITAKEAIKVFDLMAGQPDISFRFPIDGCYARAHLMVRRMQALGYRPGKAWTFARSKREPLVCRTRNHPRGYVTWRYHVAPTIRVRIDKKVYTMVIDPSMFTRPVKVRQWARVQRRYRNSRTPYYCKTRVGQPPRKPSGRRAPGSGYWPSADPRRGKDYHAERVMKLFKPYEGRVAPKKVMKMASRM
jgi:hypothetical protein